MTPQDTGPSAEMVAAIDIGSNEVRMVVADVRPEGHTEVLERTSRPVKLGHDTFVKGKLSRQTMDAAITVLRDYRRILDTYQVERVHAVATSAVREASNRDAFVDRVSRAVGIDIDVIEPMEQSRLTVSAVLHALNEHYDLKRRIGMVVEVGGGSTLVAVLHGKDIEAAQSYSIGSIRMQEMLTTAQEPPDRTAAMLRQYVANAVAMTRKALHIERVRNFIAIGGDARFAARHVGEPLTDGDLYAIRKDRFDAFVDKCAGRTVEQLARDYTLPFSEAETLVPALLVYQALMDATKADEMIVSQVSMRDGLLLDLPRFVSGRDDPALKESVLTSARNVAAKYQYDAEHAENVRHLALRLFDELQSEHRLRPRHRLLLQVAAIVHDVGGYVSTRAHHKHSYYIVTNTEFYGLKRDDIAIVAHVARYHRRSVPKSSHLDYTALPRDERMVVNKLAAMLRVADALDRGHLGRVKDLTVERRGSDLVIVASGAGDLTLERRALDQKADLFEDIFGLRVRLEEQATHAPASPEHTF